MIRALSPNDAESCDGIIAGLPDWFGNEQGILDCAEAVRAQSGLAVDEDGLIGFCTFIQSSERFAEITWMAVEAGRRGQGVGTALVDALTRRLADAGVRTLFVKTLSERGGPYPPYDATRAFYLSKGFVRTAELDIWDEENPCVLLAKSI